MKLQDQTDDRVPLSSQETLPVHVSAMSKPGAYGSDIEVAAFASMHNIAVTIHRLNQPAYRILNLNFDAV